MESWHKVYQIRRLCGTPTSEIAHYTLDLHSRPVSHLVAYSFFILLCVTLQYIVSLKLKYHYAYHYYVCFSRSPSPTHFGLTPLYPPLYCVSGTLLHYCAPISLFLSFRSRHSRQMSAPPTLIHHISKTPCTAHSDTSSS